MFTFLAIFHVVLCIILILVVLLQSGKGGGLSSAFGGVSASGMASTMFGGRGAATLLTKATVVLASLYMILVLALNYFPGSAQGPRSVIREEALKNQQASPAQGLPEAQPGRTPQPSVQQQAAPVQTAPDAQNPPASSPAATPAAPKTP